MDKHVNIMLKALDKFKDDINRNLFDYLLDSSVSRSITFLTGKLSKAGETLIYTLPEGRVFISIETYTDLDTKTNDVNLYYTVSIKTDSAKPISHTDIIFMLNTLGVKEINSSSTFRVVSDTIKDVINNKKLNSELDFVNILKGIVNDVK
ncbi:hypothetical protein ACVWU4_000963 [Campylobacter coli]